ncbi:MAG: flagellar FlbD family protein [Oscillospiraceae bacterium]|nr:flagellar FlbD family protein [Oscillospiraceae bacterium]
MKLTKLNQEPLYLNPMIIESIEQTPDTVIVLTNGKTVVVSDSVEQIIDEVVAFYNKCQMFPLNYSGDRK